MGNGIFQQKYSLTYVEHACSQLGVWWEKHQLWDGGQKGMYSDLNSFSNWVLLSMLSSSGFSLLIHTVGRIIIAIETAFL